MTDGERPGDRVRAHADRATGGARRRQGRIRLFVVDRRPARAAVRQAVEGTNVEVVGEAGCGEIALETAPSTAPDVVLVEGDLPGMTGLQLIRELGPHLPTSRLVMLAVSEDRCEMLDALRAGASGYLERGLPGPALVRSIAAVTKGEVAIPRRLASSVVVEVAGLAPDDRDPLLDRLTARELEVLGAIAAGRTDRQVATLLGIGVRTVETHVSNVLRKLGAANRSGAAARFRAR